jgi:ketosteroid isomerase-like protein
VEEARGDARLRPDNELIRRMNFAVGERDLDTFVDGLHPDVVWEHNLGGGSPEEGTYRGRENVAQLFQRIIEPWEYMRVEPHEIQQIDEGAFHISGKMFSKHVTTDAEILTPYEQRLEFENGLLIRAQMTFGPLDSDGP